MANEIDYVPFGTGAGANVLDQADFVAAAATAAGFTSGIAPSGHCNKAWRQSSMVSAMIANFIANQNNQSVLDDGNLPNLLSAFIQAITGSTSVGLYGSAGPRARLATNLNLYVATNGNDNNNGQSSTAPFATLQTAWNTAINNYDLNANQVFIHVADGTYTTGCLCLGTPVGSVSGFSGATQNAPINFVGNISSPGNVVVSVSGTNCFYVGNGATVALSGMTLTASGTSSNIVTSVGSGIYTASGGCAIINLVQFNSCSNCHMISDQGGTILTNGNPYYVHGNAQIHALAENSGYLSVSGSTITFNGSSVAFSTAFFQAVAAATIYASGGAMTYTGSCTGFKYHIAANGVLNTDGNPNTIPGSIAGITGTGGQVV